MSLILLNFVDNPMINNCLVRMKLLVLLLLPCLLLIREQYFLDHENYMFMNERREIDEVFLKQGPILKHNLHVETVGDPLPPKVNLCLKIGPCLRNTSSISFLSFINISFSWSSKYCSFAKDVIFE